MDTGPDRKPPVVLVVDDEARNVQLLESLLGGEGYATIVAANGQQALARAAEHLPDLIILDALMPGFDGFETVRRLKADPRTQPVPVIMVTALDDRDSKLRALDSGAEEFLTKPVDVADLIVRVRNLLRLKEYGDFLLDHNRILEEQVRSRTAQLESAYRETMLTLVRATEHKDEETGFHVRRISAYCRVLAAGLDQPPDFLDAIYHSSPMHDIGKIGIPDEVLLKPGALSPSEWDVMKTHCALGASILGSGSSPYTRMGAEIALNHHERWDGSGYPNGRRGDAIPLPARIMQICDVYDALRSRRPYKVAMSHEKALAVIREGDGRTSPDNFDPGVLSAFLHHAGEFGRIYDRHADP